MRGDRTIRLLLLCGTALAVLAPAYGQFQQRRLWIGGNNQVMTFGDQSSAPPDDTPLREPRLIWKNGEYLDGTLVASDGKGLTFRSDLFTEPVPLATSELARVDFPTLSPRAASENPLPAFAILLKNGDRLYADITGCSAEGLALKSDRHGEFKVPLSALQSVQRIKGGSVLYSGPQGAGGWKHYGLRDVQGFPWGAGDRGTMMTRVWNRAAILEMELPDRYEVDIVLSSSASPRFTLAFTQTSNSVQQAAIETWDDELVIAQQNRFVPVRTMQAGDRAIALRVCVDRQAGLLKIHDWSGQPLAEMKSAITSTGKNCVLIRNKGPDLALEQLTVRTWDGGALPVRETNGPWLESMTAGLQQGAVQPGADGMSLTTGGAVVPLDQLLAFDTGPVDASKLNAATAPVPAMLLTKPAAKERPTQATYADGTVISGKLVNLSEGRFNLQSTALGQPISTSLQNLLRLTLNEGEAVSQVPLAQMDALHTGTQILHGKIEGAGDATLRWRLTGATKPVPLSRRTDLEIRRPVKSEISAPSLFFLKDGNVIAAKLKGVSKEAVKLVSDVAEVTELNPELLDAVHFNRPSKGLEGFNGEGWRAVKGEPDEVKLDPGGVVVLNGNGAFGHPSVMAGDEINFKMRSRAGNGALAVDLFCPDIEERGKTTKVHLIYSGTEFWGVVESGDNNSRSSEQLRNITTPDVEVRMVFSEEGIQLFANKIALLSMPLDGSQRKGAGLVFSPSAMWGVPGREVTISDFSLKAKPDFVLAPNVSEESRRNALTIPRFRKGSPPTHVLLAPNGDVLRGRIESVSDTAITFTSGVETVDVPMERVAAAVWLDEPKQPVKEGQKAVTPPSKDGDFMQSIASHWLLLQDGSRLGVKVDRFDPDKLVAWSASLGAVTIPLDRLSVLRLSAPPASVAMKAYRGWQPEFAPEPVLPETGGQSSPMLGKAAPDFALPLVGGGQFNLAAERGKVVVLDFWATWCGPCVMSMPEQLKTMATFDPAKVKFIAVNQGEQEPQVLRFLQQRGWQMTVALDQQQDIGKRFGVEAIPHCVVIDATGKVVWTNTGFNPGDSEKMAAMIRKLISVE